MNEEEVTKKRFVLRGGNLGWGLAALGAVACVVILGWLLRPATPAPEAQAPAAQVEPAPAPAAPAQPVSVPTAHETPEAMAANATAATAATAAPAQGGYQGFEETLGVPLERIVRQVDYALVETLLLTGYDPHALAISQVELRRYHDEQYHFQHLDVTLEGAPDRFLDALGPALEKWAPESALARTDAGWDVSVMGNVTHSLSFGVAAPEPKGQATGLLAVVIDDLGRDLRFAKALAELSMPLTFSVLPHQAHTAEVAALAKSSGRELLVHLPMEPKGYPEVNPGPGALFADMDEAGLRAALAEDLAQVPGARGANNHMGSRFTTTAGAMAVVMAELKGRGMFFLDSLTAPGSQGVPQAHAAGIPVYKRSVFLDNIRDAGAIVRQLEKAERLAAATGQAVAIGHPYPETLAALKQWEQRTDRAARVVPVRTLKPVTQ